MCLPSALTFIDILLESLLPASPTHARTHIEIVKMRKRKKKRKDRARVREEKRKCICEGRKVGHGKGGMN